MGLSGCRTAAALCAITLVLSGQKAPAQGSADDPADPLLLRASDALTRGDKEQCWLALDLVRSNYPYAEPKAQAILALLDVAAAESDRVGRVSVATWPGAREAALSLTFDDGLVSAYHRAAPAIEAMGWRGTFYLFTFGLCDIEPWKDLHGRGHEIGNHSTSHCRFPAQCLLRVVEELDECTRFLHRSLATRPVLSFAYPYTDSGMDSQPMRQEVAKRFLAARGGPYEAAVNATPVKFEALPSTMVESATAVESIEQQFEKTLTYRCWMILTHHAVIDGPGWEPIPEATWEAELAAIHDVSDRLWVAPVAEVASYVLARRDAQVVSRRPGPNRIVVSIKCGLKPRQILVPLTVSVRVPSDWQEVSITGQDDLRLVRDSQVDLEVRPDGSKTVIKRTR